MLTNMDQWIDLDVPRPITPTITTTFPWQPLPQHTASRRLPLSFVSASDQTDHLETFPFGRPPSLSTLGHLKLQFICTLRILRAHYHIQGPEKSCRKGIWVTLLNPVFSKLICAQNTCFLETLVNISLHH